MFYDTVSQVSTFFQFFILFKSINFNVLWNFSSNFNVFLYFILFIFTAFNVSNFCYLRKYWKALKLKSKVVKKHSKLFHTMLSMFNINVWFKLSMVFNALKIQLRFIHFQKLFKAKLYPTGFPPSPKYSFSPIHFKSKRNSIEKKGLKKRSKTQTFLSFFFSIRSFSTKESTFFHPFTRCC